MDITATGRPFTMLHGFDTSGKLFDDNFSAVLARPAHTTRPVALRVICILLLASAVVLVFDAVLTTTVAGAVHARLAEMWAPEHPYYNQIPTNPGHYGPAWARRCPAGSVWPSPW